MFYGLYVCTDYWFNCGVQDQVEAMSIQFCEETAGYFQGVYDHFERIRTASLGLEDSDRVIPEFPSGDITIAIPGIEGDTRDVTTAQKYQFGKCVDTMNYTNRAQDD